MTSGQRTRGPTRAAALPVPAQVGRDVLAYQDQVWWQGAARLPRLASPSRARSWVSVASIFQLPTSAGCSSGLAPNDLAVRCCRAPTRIDQVLDGSFRLACHLLGRPGARGLGVQGQTAGPAAAQAPRAVGRRGWCAHPPGLSGLGQHQGRLSLSLERGGQRGRDPRRPFSLDARAVASRPPTG